MKNLAPAPTPDPDDRPRPKRRLIYDTEGQDDFVEGLKHRFASLTHMPVQNDKTPADHEEGAPCTA